MDLSACTKEQRSCVEWVHGPLFVSAGAGSGKTFTLTQRIAYALLPESGPALSGIDEVLAITFTEKAAAEIKARVKRTLRAEGLSSEALKVDGAWISTIHGMCSRILHAHALELGIDPDFGILSEEERSRMTARALDEALEGEDDVAGAGLHRALLAEFAARGGGFGASALSLVEAVVGKAGARRDGMGSVLSGAGPARAGALTRGLLVAFEQTAPVLEAAKPSAARDKACAAVALGVERMEALLAAPGGPTLEDVARELEGVPWVGRNFGTAETKQAVSDLADARGKAAQELLLGLSYPAQLDLLQLARDVRARYERAKARARKLDNDDLLVRTLSALDGHPDIARRYEGRFKLVMVDEFQDTDQVQIDLISRLAGEGACRLATVGDAQQSIYRFRGADVSVYEGRRRATEGAPGTLYVEMSKNFRSHAQVLSLVDRIFEQQSMMGERFMSLSPHEGRASSWRGEGPRIGTVLVTRPAGTRSGVTAGDVREAQADAIARKFAQLHSCGQRQGDMVLLLGVMTNALVYAEAFRRAGLECVVAGGSRFAEEPCVRLVERLVQVLENPAATDALFEVLSGDVFCLDASDLLRLGTTSDPSGERLVRRDLARGLSEAAGDEAASPRLRFARDVLERAWRRLSVDPVSRVALDVAVESGWLCRLEREGAAGMAQAANVCKAIRLIEGIERDGDAGVASVARAFSELVDAGARQAPGALSGSAGDAVRIMTVHASKGLEFPVVAVAEFEKARRPSPALLFGNVALGDAARAGADAGVGAGAGADAGRAALAVSLGPGAARSSYPGLAKRASAWAGQAAATGPGEAFAGDESLFPRAAERLAFACAEEEAEAEEAKRLLYVAVTRASEAVVMSLTGEVSAKDGGAVRLGPLSDAIRAALCGGGAFPEGTAVLHMRGSDGRDVPVAFERIGLSAHGDASAGDAASGREAANEGARPFLHLAGGLPECAGAAPSRARRPFAVSYSALSALEPHDAWEMPGEGGDAHAPYDGAGAAWDADRATAFGSAFHRAAQRAVETGRACGPDELSALVRALSLPEGALSRLSVAYARWEGSAVAAEARRRPCVRAEAPFSVALAPMCAGRPPLLLEGCIDLLCTSGPDAQGEAFVVDYKTGGAAGETSEAVWEKHLLQAQCYALALLKEGFCSVGLAFVRVEQDDGAGQPQVARYSFSADDVPALEERVVSLARGLRA